MPTIWGLHNYSDTNRFHSTGTRAVLGATTGQVWLTETGGIAKLAGDFPFNLSRQARRPRYMFTLAGDLARASRGCTSSSGPAAVHAKERFDAGLTDSKGRPRPAYCVVYQQLRHSKRCPYKTVTN